MALAIIITLALQCVAFGFGFAYADGRWNLDTPPPIYPLIGVMGVLLSLLNFIFLMPEGPFLLNLSTPVLCVAIFLGPYLEAALIFGAGWGIIQGGRFVQSLGRQARENHLDRE